MRTADMGNNLYPTATNIVDYGTYASSYGYIWTTRPRRMSRYRNLKYPFDDASWILAVASYATITSLLLCLVKLTWSGQVRCLNIIAMIPNPHQW